MEAKAVARYVRVAPRKARLVVDLIRGRSIDDARAIHSGGGNGSIIGRNCFQRPRDQAVKLLDDLVEIYKGKA